ncbi:MAG: hypothetical protein OEY33_00625 [Bdellovibrionales bacterium]|jgi:hypothetical protein|nr:hypothetical protein [Bdellovibrionales bacterium]
MKTFLLLCFISLNAYGLISYQFEGIKLHRIVEINPADYGLTIQQITTGLKEYSKQVAFCSKVSKLRSEYINKVAHDSDLICTGDKFILNKKGTALPVYVIVSDMYASRGGSQIRLQVINSKLNGYPPGHVFNLPLYIDKRKEEQIEFSKVENVGSLSQKVLQVCATKSSSCKYKDLGIM